MKEDTDTLMSKLGHLDFFIASGSGVTTAWTARTENKLDTINNKEWNRSPEGEAWDDFKSTLFENE